MVQTKEFEKLPTNIPEKFRLLTTRMLPAEEDELEEEAEWIFKHAFSTPPLSR